MAVHQLKQRRSLCRRASEFVECRPKEVAAAISGLSVGYVLLKRPPVGFRIKRYWLTDPKNREKAFLGEKIRIFEAQGSHDLYTASFASRIAHGMQVIDIPLSKSPYTKRGGRARTGARCGSEV